MRIALMPSAFHPAVGGVEELSRRLAGELRASGHSIEVWTSRRDDDDWPERDEVDGIPVRRFTFPAPRAAVGALARWPFRAVEQLLALRGAVHDFKPDVLHVQCFSTNGAYAAALSRTCGVPLVVTLQGETVMDDRDIYDQSAFLRRSIRAGFRRASAVTGCSQFTLDDAIRRFGLDAAKSSVVFNGVSLDETDQRAVTLPFSRYVAALGRAVPKKGFDLLVRAWATVQADLPDVGLVIGGGGEAEGSLSRLVAELGLDDRVHLTGRLDRAQVSWLMANSDVFVMPSRVEPFGIVALEGWRAGRPIVVSAHGGAPEFVDDGVNGLVVDPFDDVAMGAALRRLLDDVGLRKRLGTAGKVRVRDFSWDKVAADYARLYVEVLSGR